MKVTETLNKSSGLPEMHGKEERKIVDTSGPSFQNQLKQFEDMNYEERLHKLADEIVKQGKKLGDKVDVRELKAYKKLISDFLGEAVSSSHKFTKQNLLDRRGRYKVFASVKKINEELDNLTQDILSNEKDNIKILQRLDDIRGLVLDIIL
jgi:uncharacterized protein